MVSFTSGLKSPSIPAPADCAISNRPPSLGIITWYPCWTVLSQTSLSDAWLLRNMRPRVARRRFPSTTGEYTNNYTQYMRNKCAGLFMATARVCFPEVMRKNVLRIEHPASARAAFHKVTKRRRGGYRSRASCSARTRSFRQPKQVLG